MQGMAKIKEQHTHKEIVCVWIRTSNTEQFHYVVKLAVYITADRDWTFLWAGVNSSNGHTNPDAGQEENKKSRRNAHTTG